MARRRYLGATSSIIYIPKAEIETAIYATTMLAMNKLARMTSELIKLKPDGTVDETTHGAQCTRSRASVAGGVLHRAAAEVEESLCRRDSVTARSTRRALAYMPLTPRGFQRG